jgi:hypothetical protein
MAIDERAVVEKKKRRMRRRGRGGGGAINTPPITRPTRRGLDELTEV